MLRCSLGARAVVATRVCTSSVVKSKETVARGFILSSFDSLQSAAMVRSILLFLLPCVVLGWTSSHKTLQCHRHSLSSSALQMNIFDMLSGGKLVEQTSLPYSPPLCRSTSIAPDSRVLAVQERAISFTGEDFDVYDAQTNNRIVQVSGAMFHLPGKDKMRIKSGGSVVAELDRKLVAMRPTYDIYRQDGSKLGWIEKVAIAFTDTFDVYMEGKGGVGPFKAPPAYRIEGDFIDRNFVMKNSKNEIVAKVSKVRYDTIRGGIGPFLCCSSCGLKQTTCCLPCTHLEWVDSV